MRNFDPVALVFALEYLSFPIQYRHRIAKSATCNNERNVRSILPFGIMTHTRKYLIALATSFVMLLAYLFWAGARTSTPAGKIKLAVAFVGLSNSPPRQMVPTRIALSQRGATGLCAMFVVTNVGGANFWKDSAVWFETAAVEQKTAAGWQPVPQDSRYWSGIEGRVWTPGYGCLYAVGWPPGVPTNAAWRLQVRYGREASAVWIVANDMLGHGLLAKGKEEQTIPSSEVTSEPNHALQRQP